MLYSIYWSYNGSSSINCKSCPLWRRICWSTLTGSYNSVAKENVTLSDCEKKYALIHDIDHAMKAQGVEGIAGEKPPSRTLPVTRSHSTDMRVNLKLFPQLNPENRLPHHPLQANFGASGGNLQSETHCIRHKNKDSEHSKAHHRDSNSHCPTASSHPWSPGTTVHERTHRLRATDHDRDGASSGLRDDQSHDQGQPPTLWA